MVANLTPQYQKAEQEYRRAQTPQEQVDCLTLMIKLIPKHKGTEKLQADLKSRLKDARDEVEVEKKTPKKAAGGPGHRIPRQGAGQVLLLGGPNGGKSRLLKELTNAMPEVAPYPFTTREPLPGMMPWEDVQVQMIDTPPCTPSHFEPYILNMVRTADLVVLTMDGSSDDAPEETAAVVQLLADRKTKLASDSGFDEDDFSTIHVKTLLVVTRGDDPGAEIRLDLLRELAPLSFEVVFVELDRPESREELRNRIYSELDLIRIYTKVPGKPADLTAPYAIGGGGTVEDLAAKVHRDLAEKLKFAKVWGTSARDGQTVSREHVLADKDLVELHA